VAEAPRRLDGDFLRGPVEEAARGLLGALVVRDDAAGRRVARIVETEAYAGPEDRASHARFGRTPRNAVMFGPPGHAYVYLVYGLHHCLNVVCGVEGVASAVLIRAVAPVEGSALMRAHRARSGDADWRLGAGPARACQALDIDRGLNGIDLLTDGRLWVAGPGHDGALKAGQAGRPGDGVCLPGDDGGLLAPSERIVSGPRIGVAYAGSEWAVRPWRFGIAGHPSLSRPFAADI
jgi:DNA-3-methyladenine glycosylase